MFGDEYRDEDEYGPELEYAKDLAVYLWKTYYKSGAPQWKPLDDLMGLLSQIDNMIACLPTIERVDSPCDRAGFVCALCRKRKVLSKIQQQFGLSNDYPDFLCSDCYSSVTAREWDKIGRELQNDHEDDFE